MILLVLGGALASFSLIEKGQVGRDEGDLKAYYIARSGADLVAQAVLENEDDFEDIKGKTTKPVTLGQGSFTAKIEEFTSGVRIISTGVVGNRKRTVTLVLRGGGSAPLIDHAIYASGNINITGGVTIEGDVATNSDKKPAVTMTGGAEILPDVASGHEGTVFVRDSIPKEYREDYVAQEEGNTISGGVKGKDIPIYNEINFPDTPTIGSSPEELVVTVTETKPYIEFSSTERHFSKLKINGQGGQKKFQIDLKHKDCTLVIDYLDLSNSANIEIINPGHLDLHVKEINIGEGDTFYLNLDIAGTGDQDEIKAKMRDSDESIITFYYSGDAPFGADNAAGSKGIRFMYVGTLVTNKADIFLHQDSSIKGNILTNAKNMVVGNNALIDVGLVYAPNAKFELKNGGQTRAIICETFDSSGGPSEERPFNAKFEPIDPNTLPEGVLPSASGGTRSFVRSHWER